MNPPPRTKSPASPEVTAAQRWNIVWVVPILAAIIGGWLLYRNFATQGPTATVRFETAEEIYAGKTEVRCRSVKVGIVKKVTLNPNLSSVNVIIEVDPAYDSLLCEGSRFWVVKPRLTGAEISGLGTLIQGAYIELDPGPVKSKRLNHFDGMEVPPATSSSVPGRRLVLTSEAAGPLQIGAPIDYLGFEVGRIEGREISEDGSRVIYNAFISKEYSHLITNNTRFWNTSGIEINSSTRGVVLRTPSLQAMVSGGVSFGRPSGVVAGEPCEDGRAFTLYPDKESAQHSAFDPTLQFLLQFDQSVQGLTTNSAVEFRGIPFGRIAQISYDLIDSANDSRIPVLIEIDPKRVNAQSGDLSEGDELAFFEREIANGLRAGLKTTSLVTGTMHIDFDYYPNTDPAKLGKTGDYTTFPTTVSGFTQIEARLSALIDQLQDTPAQIGETAGEARALAGAARKWLEDPAVKQLPGELKESVAAIKKAASAIGPDGQFQNDLQQTLEQLRDTLQSFKALADLLEEKPNALIFGKPDEDRQRAPAEPRIGAPHHRR